MRVLRAVLLLALLTLSSAALRETEWEKNMRRVERDHAAGKLKSGSKRSGHVHAENLARSHEKFMTKVTGVSAPSLATERVARERDASKARVRASMDLETGKRDTDPRSGHVSYHGIKLPELTEDQIMRKQRALKGPHVIAVIDANKATEQRRAAERLFLLLIGGLAAVIVVRYARNYTRQQDWVERLSAGGAQVNTHVNKAAWRQNIRNIGGL
mmetsp:Transcript_14137/g.17144  ORF Transcript_14137/g.17144 Transcript_14137/m.17144 type:complete len:214 (+) Transcript_14137:277-918(+)|eukprot:CAMPEP_0197848088 /NCGR_PEP_ID=MMETSP1438-20131217/7919_1 /TAXON_ID=1461541 /ORGANISM="Pterosperma sp., Strain CCMP1384" /LENGTH=213 /DNA_ID=CAMNT_0043460219 /DNA_START=270 /DNA_END=911 /DNA_ORIENTATION=+